MVPNRTNDSYSYITYFRWPSSPLFVFALGSSLQVVYWYPRYYLIIKLTPYGSIDSFWFCHDTELHLGWYKTYFLIVIHIKYGERANPINHALNSSNRLTEAIYNVSINMYKNQTYTRTYHNMLAPATHRKLSHHQVVQSLPEVPFCRAKKNI